MYLFSTLLFPDIVALVWVIIIFYLLIPGTILFSDKIKKEIISISNENTMGDASRLFFYEWPMTWFYNIWGIMTIPFLILFTLFMILAPLHNRYSRLIAIPILLVSFSLQHLYIRLIMKNHDNYKKNLGRKRTLPKDYYVIIGNTSRKSIAFAYFLSAFFHIMIAIKLFWEH